MRIPQHSVDLWTYIKSVRIMCNCTVYKLRYALLSMFPEQLEQLRQQPWLHPPARLLPWQNQINFCQWGWRRRGRWMRWGVNMIKRDVLQINKWWNTGGSVALKRIKAADLSSWEDVRQLTAPVVRLRIYHHSSKHKKFKLIFAIEQQTRKIARNSDQFSSRNFE